MGDLFGIRNQLYIGNYQQVVTDASGFNARGDMAAKLECETLLHRAHIALGNHFLVLQKIRDSDPVALQAVKLLATYIENPEGSIEKVGEQLDEWMDDSSTASDATMLVIAAMIYNREGQPETALRFVHTAATLEMMATLVYTYMAMDRLDLAEKTFASMQQAEDDATLTQLAAAWIQVAKGGDSIKKAYFIFADLADKYGGVSVTLLNGQASCHMSKGEFEDAEQLLQQALAKNPSDVDTLINLVVCLQHQQKSEDLLATNLSLLKKNHPSHPWVKHYARLEESFERVS